MLIWMDWYHKDGAYKKDWPLMVKLVFIHGYYIPRGALCMRRLKLLYQLRKKKQPVTCGLSKVHCRFFAMLNKEDKFFTQEDDGQDVPFYGPPFEEGAYKEFEMDTDWGGDTLGYKSPDLHVYFKE